MEQQLLVNQITKLHSKLGAPWVCRGLSVGRWVGFPGVFWGFFGEKMQQFGGKREESCLMMHPDLYSSCHTHQLKNSLFLKTELRKKRSLHVASKNIDQANKRLIHRLSCFFFFSIEAVRFSGLKMVDYLERMRWLFWKET